MKKNLTEKEIEQNMEVALKKIPLEIKKIKFALEIIKKLKKLKKFFKLK